MNDVSVEQLKTILNVASAKVKKNKTSLQLLQAVLDALPIAVVVKDASGEEVLNSKMAELKSTGTIPIVVGSDHYVVTYTLDK